MLPMVCNQVVISFTRIKLIVKNEETYSLKNSTIRDKQMNIFHYCENKVDT